MADVVVDERRPAVRRVYWDRAATVVTIVLAVITVVLLTQLSDIYHYDGLTFMAAWLLPYALGFAWLILVVRAIRYQRIWAPLLVLPVAIALIATADSTEFAAKLRWDLSRPSMNAYVQSLPAPPPSLTEEPSAAEVETYSTTFRGACPALLGTYRIVECRTIPGGYVFLTSIEDDGEGTGVAYLPLTGSSYDWSMQSLAGSNTVSSWTLAEPWHVVLITEF